MMICLENGDILKCNIQNALKAANIDEEDSPAEAPRIYKPSLTIEVSYSIGYLYFIVSLKFHYS